MKSFNLNLISKYRTEIMGVATTMIIICHAPYSMSLSPLMARFLSFWSVGVDVFLFLSGLGLCYSYEMKKVSIASWYRKRFFRILLPSLIIQLLFVSNDSIVDFLKFFTGISFWANHKGFWFVDLLIVLYFAFPVLFKMLNRSRNKGVVISVLCCLLMCILPNVKEWGNAVMINICMVCQYIPSFVLGVLVFPLVKGHKRIDLRYILPFCLLGTLFFIVLSHRFQLQLYPGIFYSCIIVIVCSFILDYVPIGQKVFAFFGKISLESYLINVSFPTFLLRIGICGGAKVWWFYPVATVIGLLIAVMVHKISQSLLGKMKC